MDSIQKEKLRVKIINGQSLKMLAWEFKITKKEIIRFAAENNLVLRQTSGLSHAGRVHGKSLKTKKLT